MTAEEQKEIDEQRKDNEEALLLLLLGLIGTQYAELREGDEAGEMFRTMLLSEGVATIAGSMADAHLDAERIGVERYSPGVGIRQAFTREQLIELYTAQAREMAEAMADTLAKQIAAAGGDVAAALVAAKYTRSDSTNIEMGAERKIVSAFNGGLVVGALQGGQITGLRHVSVIDDRTTAICIERGTGTGVQLPADHRYWLFNWPSLHGHCRSIVEPLVGVYEETIVLPVIPPAPGYGRAPLAVQQWLQRRARAA